MCSCIFSQSEVVAPPASDSISTSLHSPMHRILPWQTISHSQCRAPGQDASVDLPQNATDSDSKVGAMMRVHRFLGVLAVGALLQACWDDPESPPSRPPDLRMEDVVGCWTEGVQDDCSIRCFDHEKRAWNRSHYPSGRAYEEVGVYELRNWEVDYRGISRTTTSKADSIRGSISYRRVGPDLYTLTYDLQLGTRYTPVNLDSTLPCGTPFQLLPKPEGWTLF